MSSHLINFRNILFFSRDKSLPLREVLSSGTPITLLTKEYKKRLALGPDVCYYFLIDFLAPGDSIDLPGHVACLIGG